MPLQPKGYHSSEIENKILRTVEQTIRAYRMLQPGDAVLVAVSGGADSVALVHILLSLAATHSFRVAIAHLNHGLRKKESDRDAEFVAALAKNLALPSHIKKVDVRRYQQQHNLSLEEAARQVRYSLYNSVAAKWGYSKIALGHHRDDNAELVLMYFLRGSGPLGLSGIPPVRAGKIIRPLINVKRSEIIDYITIKRLSYVSDTSNLDPKYIRNRIRNRLIPELKTDYNPKLTDTLNRLANLLRSEEEWLEDLIHPIFLKSIRFEAADRLGLSISKLNQIAIAARRRLIRKAILHVKGNLRRIAFVHIEAVVRLAEIGPSCGMLDLPGRICIRRDNGVLVISKKETDLRNFPAVSPELQISRYEYQISAPGVIFIKEANVHIQFSEIPAQQLPALSHSGQRVAFFDMNKLHFPLIIRNFRPGDRFSPLGVDGTQKLKKFFIDHKISRNERAKCPLVLSQQKIIWLAGHRLDNSVKVGPKTLRILRGELLLA
jgi:tRNA(Ile)-lysidine synthase